MSWNSPKFRVGEQVELQSGGGSMTIESVGEVVRCVWKDRTGRILRDEFSRDCLKQSSEADGHIIFLPKDQLNENGIRAFMEGKGDA